MARTIAIGDVHGCLAAFLAVLKAADLQTDDTLVLLGDYVDRGPDTKGVLEHLIALSERQQVITVFGNHDEMMLQAQERRSDLRFWLNCGGDAVLRSYGDNGDLSRIPASHFAFLESCPLYYETATHIFVHANYNSRQPVERFDGATLRWRSLRDFVPPEPHMSGKTVVVGHTPQDEVLDLGYLIGLDTGCCYGGWLTAMELESKQVWQANAGGQLRQ